MVATDRVAILASDELGISSASNSDHDKSSDDNSTRESKRVESNYETGMPPKQDSTESSGIPDMQIYSRRWYILILFSILACHQCLVWNTWGPIASSVQTAYGWTDGTVAMMANWGTITFVLSAIPLSWFIETYGLRPVCILVSGMIMVGTLLRLCRKLVPNNPTLFLAASHLCSILNGITGVTIMSSPPIISSIWFPQHERTTATAINQAGNMLGNGLTMLIGPAMVMVNSTDSGNSSSWLHTFLGTSLRFNNNIPTNREIDDIKNDIDNYMLLQFGVALVLFVCFVVYYPSKPPLPPSPTSAIVRTDYLRALKEVVSNREILLACFAYAISQGIVGVWMSVLVLNLRPLGITDQTEVGYIGLVSVIGSCIMSIVCGIFMDIFRHKIKKTLIVLLTTTSVLFVILLLMCNKVIPSGGVWGIAFAIVLATSLSGACCPLFFELSVEIAYPASENVVAVFLTTGNNFFGMIFLFIFFIPNIGSAWINYSLIGSSLVALPAVIMIKERYNRSTVDELITGIM